MMHGLYNDLYILNDTGYGIELLSDKELKITTPDYVVNLTLTDDSYIKLILETSTQIRYMGSVSTYALGRKNVTVLVALAIGQIVAFAEMGGVDE